MQTGKSGSFRLIGAKDIEKWLGKNQQKLFNIVRDIYVTHAAGKTINPDSYFLRYPDSEFNRIIALPASIEDDRPISGIKWIASFPGNLQLGLNRASALLILNDRYTGYPIACLESSVISAARTAASAAVGAHYLHPNLKYAKRLGVIGCGLISFSIVKLLIDLNWNIDEIVLHDISSQRSELFKNKCNKFHDNINISELKQTVCESDIVLFTTSAVKPFINDLSWFKHNPTVLHMSLRDISTNIIFNAQNIADDIDHCLKAQTSLHLAELESGDRKFMTGSISEVINGSITADSTRPRIFSPFGMGILDIAVAREILNENSEINCKEFFDFFPEPYLN